MKRQSSAPSATLRAALSRSTSLTAMSQPNGRVEWAAFTLIEMLIVMAIIAILAGLLLPALTGAREQSRRKSCGNNLSQIGKACISYQEPNGDFFPAFLQATIGGQENTAVPTAGQGADGTFQPMPSLACLYPTYCPEVKIFGCPSTTDAPQIAFQYYTSSTNVSSLHTCFGFASYNSIGALISTVDPAAYTGNEVGATSKCSYLYDELAQPRDLSADQAMAADADGQTWLLPGNQHPGYASGWKRTPQKPNHNNGQNVMYMDGHVKWTDNATCSHDPSDNIFCPNSTNGVQWNPDIDSYLWDGLDARAVQP
jgi:prepilin-type N-terminal cleavage/methylation domain-containing protein/prepilin-type processing-associated H-X9-DG protein